MKWTHPDPKDRDTCKRSGFLWLPMTIGFETRWLERAVWREEFRNVLGWGRWRAVAWLDSAGHPRQSAAEMDAAYQAAAADPVYMAEMRQMAREFDPGLPPDAALIP